MSCKERPKFNIRIELIREEIKNEILIEKEIKFKYQNIRLLIQILLVKVFLL